MEGWTRGGGAWRCVVGGRGEGLRRAGPALHARGFSPLPWVRGAWLGSARRARAGLAWASQAERTPDPGPRPFGAGPGWPGRGLALGTGQLSNSPWDSAAERGSGVSQLGYCWADFFPFRRRCGRGPRGVRCRWLGAGDALLSPKPCWVSPSRSVGSVSNSFAPADHSRSLTPGYEQRPTCPLLHEGHPHHICEMESETREVQ